MSNLDHQAARRWHRLAWLPIPLLLAAIIAARVAGGRGTYVNDDLRLVLSSICYTLVAVATLVLIGRSFLASGAPGLLLLECGVVRTESTQLADLMAAARLALDLGHPIKDCIYLALAMKLGCELLTSDRRFAAKDEPVWPKVRVLEG